MAVDFWGSGGSVLERLSGGYSWEESGDGAEGEQWRLSLSRG